jgi:hypothetical protein
MNIPGPRLVETDEVSAFKKTVSAKIAMLVGIVTILSFMGRVIYSIYIVAEDQADRGRRLSVLETNVKEIKEEQQKQGLSIERISTAVGAKK